MTNNQLDENSDDNAPVQLNRDIIRRAIYTGVNVNVIADQIEKALTYEQKGEYTFDDVLGKYQAFLDAIKTILLDYNMMIEIGREQSFTWTPPIYLDQKGIILPMDIRVSTVGVQIFFSLYHPNRILNNLLSEITMAEYIRNKVKEVKDKGYSMESLNFASDKYNKIQINHLENAVDSFKSLINEVDKSKINQSISEVSKSYL